ncbi:efflux RND transporter periplasmic adaptor subunit [Rhizobium leguminosarum bv. viciae]|uniref:Efflux RND transporter periplasmic adaptor subunit n=1 Tax=Rhizobium leguminosarum bv. viciae TaxID=387 RepID=A0A8I2GVZ4_RHILV|nr:efflux RND transporter periplasmic adaptor subunit [Rhizobium leguminosarum]MBY5791196.1 efflux RND transporter periplasmic adaptor subunit [Rhizobium leguminosarum]NKL99095.1 efflux RND transporter periplasmic adaptor subunit [Rhizobium leguminosarum bv. viciae]NKM46359.1 efflux RND transporter periplasmic adaptor subunit [Rhizobium leguminosarum bv. viciae]TCA06667.1 efflux RND transporter periplasmic adaptor subunit [Rhizobium leguminosarum bv. viciae]UFW76354.1 efflux RND transporter pe
MPCRATYTIAIEDCQKRVRGRGFAAVGHSGGMNTTSEHDRDLAAKLRSLSIEPAPFKTEPPEPRVRRRVIPGAMLALVATALLAVAFVHRPDTLERMLAGLISKDEVAISVDGTDVSAAGPIRPLPSNTPANRALPSREVTGSGYVVAPDIATIFSKYEGRIVAVEVEAGDRIVAGQMLVLLDDAGARFALQGAEIARQSAELALTAKTIELAQARSSLTRTERLAGRDAMSAQTLEEAKTAFDTAENAALQARQDVAKADLDIDRAREQVEALTVRAPISGTVTRLTAHVGDTVLSREDSVRENESLLAIADMANMVIDADVAEANIALMRPGLRGEAVLDGFPDRPFAVEVSKIAPMISREKGTVTLRLSLSSPPSDMRPAMAARIRLLVGEAGDSTDHQQGAER